MINVNPVTSLALYQVKKNFELIGREAESLQKPTDADYLTSFPNVSELAELQSVYVLNGGTMYRVSRVGGTRYRVGLTAF